MRAYRQLTDEELEEIWSRFAAGENMFANRHGHGPGPLPLPKDPA